MMNSRLLTTALVLTLGAVFCLAPSENATAGTLSFTIRMEHHDEWPANNGIRILANHVAIWEGDDTSRNWGTTNKVHANNRQVAQSQRGKNGTSLVEGQEIECYRYDGCSADGFVPFCDDNFPSTYQTTGHAILYLFNTNKKFHGYSRVRQTGADCTPREEDPGNEENGDCNGPGGDCTPLLLDLAGTGFQLSGAALPVSFDLDRDGEVEQAAWTAIESDDAFLAMDRDGNGTIDAGHELFGNATPVGGGVAENGFLALAELDRSENGGNEDGLLSHLDEGFSSILLWRDYNRNAYSDSWELVHLDEEGVTEIDLAYTEVDETDEFGNGLRLKSTAVVNGEVRTVCDVYFKVR